MSQVHVGQEQNTVTGGPQSPERLGRARHRHGQLGLDPPLGGGAEARLSEPQQRGPVERVHVGQRLPACGGPARGDELVRAALPGTGRAEGRRGGQRHRVVGGQAARQDGVVDVDAHLRRPDTGEGVRDGVPRPSRTVRAATGRQQGRTATRLRLLTAARARAAARGTRGEVLTRRRERQQSGPVPGG